MRTLTQYWRTHRRVRAGVLAAVVTTVGLLATACDPNPYVGNPAAPKIAVVGDSLTYWVQDRSPQHLNSRGWYASVSGVAGFAVADQFDMISKDLATNPQAMVLALGTNDIRKMNDGTQSWDGFRADVRQALAMTKSVPCVAWIGVSDSSGYYGPAGDLATMGWYMNWIVQQEIAASGRAAGTTFYGDWASISRRGDYYVAPGDPHHSEIGKNAYAELITRTAGQCPGAPILSANDSVIAGAGNARLVGWAFDPDAKGSAIDLHVYVDGKFNSVQRTGKSRPDVQAYFGYGGNNNGYDFNVGLTKGRHNVCLYAINVGPGTTNPNIGCWNVTAT